MGEIYRDTVGAGLAFDIETATVSKAEFIRDGEVVHTVNNNSTAAIPFAITKSSGPFTVKWTFSLEGDTHERLEEHTVVTPLFDKDALVDWDADFSVLTESKVKYLERLVRQIIQVYCNQKFERFVQTVVLKATADGTYYAPEKIIKINNATYTLGSGGFSVHNLDTYTSQGINVKIPIEAELVDTWHAPYAKKSVAVTGEFGWLSVPSEVKTAALYLAEVFTCDESLWRERYIKSVRAADWRFDYSEEAFHSTGSAIADQILEPFKRIGFAVV